MKDLYDVVRVLLNQAPNISEAIKDAARDVLDQADPKVKQAAEDAAAVADRADRAELERLQQKFAARQTDGKDTPADA